VALGAGVQLETTMQRTSMLAAALCVGAMSSAFAGSHLSCSDSQAPTCAAPACTVCEQSMSACGCMVCGTGCCGCPSAMMPTCSVCDGGMSCWDCCFQEAIDVDSLTPEAKSRQLYDSGLARIDMILPDDGTVYLMGQMMMTLGVERTFTVPVPDRSKIYAYDLRFEFVRGGKKYFKKVKLDGVRAGAIILVGVEAPPVPDGEPGVIVVAAEVVLPGGVGTEPEEGEAAGGVGTDYDS